MRCQGELSKGVGLPNGWFAASYSRTGAYQQKERHLNIIDNKLLVAVNLKKQDSDVTIVSKDLNTRIKANALGIKANDFEQDKVNVADLYQGFEEILLDKEELNEVAQKGYHPMPDREPNANEFVLFKNKEDSNDFFIGQSKGDSGEVQCLRHKQKNVFSVSPPHPEQAMAMELLLDDKIELVTLVGQAGTGKTLIALACGLRKIIEE